MTVLHSLQKPGESHPATQALEMVANFIEHRDPTTPGLSDASTKIH